MPAPALLDLSRLEIALGGDTSMIGDILEMYESTAQADLDALADALKAAARALKQHFDPDRRLGRVPLDGTPE